MSGDAHVRICESLGVQFPRATRLFVTIRGKQMYLWRAVDNEGEVLDFLVQSRRNAKAARKLMKKLLKPLQASIFRHRPACQAEVEVS